MRHGKKLNHLSRTSAHRKAMMANMASSLILNKRIRTTTAKAKALRIFIEPLITKAKTDNTHSRRIVFRYLQDKYAVSELFRDVAEKVADRPGGYTRILKTGSRQGDNAEMCFIELVDYNETYTDSESKKSKAGKKRRRRGGKKKAQTEEQTQKQQVAENESDVEETSSEAQNQQIEEGEDTHAEASQDKDVPENSKDQEDVSKEDQKEEDKGTENKNNENKEEKE
ncbi:MAG: 50S ribosomal protein L17 [Bacteroidota bacterium]